MNLTFIIGLLAAIAFMVNGMMQGATGYNPAQIGNFFDPASILITVGGTIATVVTSYPMKMLKQIPKHFKIILNTKKHNPTTYIEELVELAQIARKNGLLALEEKANQQQDAFFKQSIMLIVDSTDPEKLRSILNNDIECLSARHDDVAGMYEKASAVAPAFGMIGTLVGLINMLKNMDPTSGSSSIGTDMGTALITTLYGCIMAHMMFSPIANNLRIRDAEECLCKQIILEGVVSIQAGENPKFIKEKLLGFMEEKQRDAEAEGGKEGKGGKGGKAPKAPKKKK